MHSWKEAQIILQVFIFQFIVHHLSALCCLKEERDLTFWNGRISTLNVWSCLSFCASWVFEFKGAYLLFVEPSEFHPVAPKFSNVCWIQGKLPVLSIFEYLVTSLQSCLLCLWLLSIHYIPFSDGCCLHSLDFYICSKLSRIIQLNKKGALHYLSPANIYMKTYSSTRTTSSVFGDKKFLSMNLRDFLSCMFSTFPHTTLRSWIFFITIFMCIFFYVLLLCQISYWVYLML